jgi:SP family myo-inositol transporter-like MFS transporter 13
MDPETSLSRDNSEDEKANVIHDEVFTSQSIDDSIETTDPGKAVWVIACTVSMGGFLFGTWNEDN